jgi:hypothetical protein
VAVCTLVESLVNGEEFRGHRSNCGSQLATRCLSCERVPCGGTCCPCGAQCGPNGCVEPCPGGPFGYCVTSEAPDCCSGWCVDTISDPNNCGTCGNSCSEVCCLGTCVFTSSDQYNCGGCGNKCGANQYCEYGECTCPDGQECDNNVCIPGGASCCPDAPNGYCVAPDRDCCGSSCTNKSEDPNNCGDCGTTCSADQTCAQGKCTCTTLALPDACPSGCVNFGNDPNNCGGCNIVCPSGWGCCGGNCTQLGTSVNCGACSDACPSGAPDCCDSTCVNTLSDLANCGSCGAVCGESCCMGQCLNTSKDPNNCGACGKTCPSGRSCCEATCVDTLSDSNNCGGCNTVCAGGQTCQNATCSCPGSETLCGGQCTDTSQDPKNCGGCGNKCAKSDTCCSGSCVNLTSDSNNCGECGTKCNVTSPSDTVYTLPCVTGQCNCAAAGWPTFPGGCCWPEQDYSVPCQQTAPNGSCSDGGRSVNGYCCCPSGS